MSRPSVWGNPYVVSRYVTPRQAVARYRFAVENGLDGVPTLSEIRRSLSGRDLACWCPLGQPCHADVLLDLSNRRPDASAPLRHEASTEATCRLPIPGYHGDMALVNSNGFAHVRLTVTDIDRSKSFYDQVFGWPAAIDMSATVAEPGVTESPEQFYGGVVYQTPQGTLFGLRPVGSTGFDSEHTGLDHVSFAVESRDDLEQAASALEDAGIAHGEVTDLTEAGLAILSFQDPDDINVELTAPLG